MEVDRSASSYFSSGVLAREEIEFSEVWMKQNPREAVKSILEFTEKCPAETFNIRFNHNHKGFIRLIAVLKGSSYDKDYRDYA